MEHNTNDYDKLIHGNSKLFSAIFVILLLCGVGAFVFWNELSALF